MAEAGDWHLAGAGDWHLAEPGAFTLVWIRQLTDALFWMMSAIPIHRCMLSLMSTTININIGF